MNTKSLALPLCLALSACSERPAAPAPPPAEAATALRPPEPLAPTPMTVTTRSPQAREAFLRAARLQEDLRLGEAVPALAEALRLDPDFALAHAVHAFGAAPTPERLAEMDRAVALSQASGFPEPERVWIAHLSEGLRGNEAAARALLMKAAELLPRDSRIQFAVAEQYFSERRFDEAITHYALSSSLDPTGPADNMLGYSYVLAGRPDLGVEALKRYVQTHPGDPNPPDSLAEVAMASGDLAEADAAFRRALAIDPRYYASWHGLAQLRFYEGDYKAGYAALDRARAVAPPNSQLQLDVARAWALVAEGKPREGLAQLDRVERDAGKHAQSYYQALAPVYRGAILSELGKGAEAERQLQLGLTRASALKGNPGLVVRRRALLWKVLEAARAGKSADAGQALALLVEEGKKTAVGGELRAALYLARGAVAELGGDREGALREYSRCDPRGGTYNYGGDQRSDDLLCIERKASLEAALGQPAQAEKTRRAILTANGRDPLSVPVRARVARLLK